MRLWRWKLEIVALSLLVISCKTTEKNYREAYELAKETTRDSTMLKLIEKEQSPSLTVIDGESVDLRKEYVSVVDEDGVPKKELKQYNIVVGRYRQIFNARSMQTRMKALGYDAFVVQTREPAYFVVTYSSDLIKGVSSKMKEMQSDKRIVIKAPYPWVLEPAQYLRHKNAF